LLSELRGGGVIVNVNVFDLEVGLGGRRAGAPALVAVGPVVEDPGTGSTGNIASGVPDFRAVNEPPNTTGSPVQAILVLGRSRATRWWKGLGRRDAVPVGILVGEPDLAGALVAQGRRIRKPFNIRLLGVVFVKEHAVADASGLTKDRDSTNRSVLHVTNGCGYFSGAVRHCSLATGDLQVEVASANYDVRGVELVSVANRPGASIQAVGEAGSALEVEDHSVGITITSNDVLAIGQRRLGRAD